jgi:hypothetical protein
MMITTTKGDMDESLLQKSVGSTESDKEIISWVEYRLDDELVHRSVHVVLKQNVAADGVAAAIG